MKTGEVLQRTDENVTKRELILNVPELAPENLVTTKAVVEKITV